MGGCAGKTADAPKPGSKSGSSVPKKEIKEGGIGHAQFIIENTGKITDYYQLDRKKLGEGSYGSVCKANNISTKAIRAVKTISKSQMKNLERFKQEIAIMKMMDHPNIIKLFESFEDHRNIYLVMELCSGGELFDRIIESGHFSEQQAAILMQQIIRAIYYMHENQVCHRDLKPENFLFMTKDPIEKNFLKIIDFGLSCKFTPGKPLSTKAGTPYYVAPQVLAGNYDQLSDLWSCGVIMYVLLCGYPPFFGDTDSEVLAKVRLGNFNFNPADWKNVSEDAKTLIRHLLKMNPKDRYTAEQALNHEWIKNKDFNQGKAQERYNDVCREEQILQVLEHPAPLGYERMVVGIYQMPAPMKDREFLWREWAALLPTEDGGQLYVSVAMTPSPEESAAILQPNDKFVRGHLHLAATMARQDPDSYEVSACSVIMGDVKGSMPKAVQNMVAGNASSYLINFRDAHSR